jgi:serine/threonine protein kinase
MAKPPVKLIGKYVTSTQQLGECIGKGAYGKVFKALDTETAVIVAIKQVSMLNINEDQLGGLRKEINMLKRLSHRNIVRYLGEFYLDSNTTDSDLNIILEYIENGSLAAVIRSFTSISERIVSIYIKQVLQGLVYLHSQGVVHRDIKGANILVTKEGIVKLADFGVAMKLDDTLKSGSLVGSPFWMAPEIIVQTGHCSSACDIWSLGCTVIELLTGSPPYYELGPMPALFRIAENACPPLPPNISAVLKDFLLQCFQKEPLLRVNAQTLLGHDFILSSSSMTPAILEITPASSSSNESSDQDEPLDDEILTIVPIKSSDEYSEPSPTFSQKLNGLMHRESSVVLEESKEDSFSVPSLSKDQWSAENTSRSLKGYDSESNIAAALKSIALFHDGSLKTEVVKESPTAPQLHHSKSSKSGLSKSTRITSKETSSLECCLKRLKVSRDFSIVAERNSDISIEAEQRIVWETKQAHEMDSLIEGLTVSSPELLKSELQVLEALKLNPALKEVTSGALISLKEVLDESEVVVIQHLALQIINQLTENDLIQQELLCTTGLLPSVLRFVGDEYPRELRVEAAYLIGQLCHSSPVSLKLFLAGGGLEILVKLLDPNYEEHKDLVMLALDCMLVIVDAESCTDDYLGVWSASGAVERLILTIDNLAQDCINTGYLHKAADLWLVFSTVSPRQGPKAVQLNCCEEETLAIVVSFLQNLTRPVLCKVLKGLQYLSAERAVHAVKPTQRFENVGLITDLVKVLGLEGGECQYEMHLTCLKTLYYLCRLSPARQEQFVLAGGIPFLTASISRSPKLSKVAVPLLVMFPGASKACRKELQRQRCLGLFVSLLASNEKVIDGLVVWVSLKHRLADELAEHGQKLAEFFCASEDFEVTVQYYVKLLSSSSSLCRELSRCDQFVEVLASHLQQDRKNPAVTRHSLELMHLLASKSDRPRALMDRFSLYQLVLGILHDSRYDDLVILEEVATLLLDLYSRSVK